jgi:hypothetical protein
VSNGPRYLGRALGYTHSPSPPYAIDRLEAVTEEEQDEITRRVRLAREREQQRAWERARGEITHAVDVFTEEARPGSRVRSNLRLVTRAVASVDRALSASDGKP